MDFIAFVTDPFDGKKKFKESFLFESNTKGEFLRDLRGNGYKVAWCQPANIANALIDYGFSCTKENFKAAKKAFKIDGEFKLATFDKCRKEITDEYIKKSEERIAKISAELAIA